MDFSTSSDQPTPNRIQPRVGIPRAQKFSNSRGCPHGRIGFIARAFGAGLLILVSHTLALRVWGQDSKESKDLVGGKQRRVLSEAEQLAEQSKQASERTNGVLLLATPSVEGKGKDRKIVLHWSLDYQGPRHPLIILKPNLEWPAHLQTYVIFYLIDRRGDTHKIVIHAKGGSAFRPLVRDYFAEVNKGQVAKGTLSVIRVPELEAKASKQFPDIFPVLSPQRVFIRLYHDPAHRGELVHRRVYDSSERPEFEDIDAWTGRLQTKPLEIPVASLRASSD